MATAGKSAQREYERRLARHRARLSAMLPLAVAIVVVGGVAAWKLFDRIAPGTGGWFGLLAVVGISLRLGLPGAHIVSWQAGADGERRMARLLEPLERQGFRMLPDRRIPPGAANIDHIVVDPPGIAVIETKSYRGQVRVRGGELFVNGRRRTDVVNQVHRQIDCVRVVLGADADRSHAPILAFICIHRARLPWQKLQIRSVHITEGMRLCRVLARAPSKLQPAEIDRLASLLDARLPEA